MSGIVLRNLGKRYATAGQAPAAVDGVSFDAPRGTLTTLLGPSGCGKSTVLRLIAGLESMDGGGEVWIGGRDVTAMPPELRGVGLVFQNYALFPHLDVLDNVCFGMRALRLPVEQRRAQGLKALHAAGLQGLEKRRPAQLSGGQQQRVALARALVLEPSVLLLDEPLSNLDARLRRNMRQEIRDLQRRLDLTVIYVTHDHHEALAVSDQIVVMNAGRVAQAGTPHALYESPSGEFVAAFMGDASLFNANCDGAVMALGPLRIAAPEGAPTGAVRVAIRPEAWRIGPANGSGLPASVQKCTYQGHAIEYVFATPVGRVLAVSREVRYPLEPGAPASLHLAGHGICVLESGA